MARPGIRHYETARSLSARPGFRVLLLADVVLHVGAAVWAALRLASHGDTYGWVALAVSLATIASSVACMGLRPRGANWRRRLGFVAVIFVVLRQGPFAHMTVVPVFVTLWTGWIWIALLLEGRRVAAAVVEATGEEGLGDDPSRHL